MNLIQKLNDLYSEFIEKNSLPEEDANEILYSYDRLTELQTKWLKAFVDLYNISQDAEYHQNKL